MNERGVKGKLIEIVLRNRLGPMCLKNLRECLVDSKSLVAHHYRYSEVEIQKIGAAEVKLSKCLKEGIMTFIEIFVQN